MQLDLPLDRGSLLAMTSERKNFDAVQLRQEILVEGADDTTRVRVLPVTAEGAVAVRSGRLWAGPADLLNSKASLLGELGSGEMWVSQVVGPEVATDIEAAYSGVNFLSVVQVASELTDEDALIAAQAGALVRWQSTTKFCGRCGSGLEIIDAGWAQQCSGCDHTEFPRTDPAVIVLILNHAGEALLAHNTAWEPNRYSLVAGFVEAGESPRRTVIRETLEEVNLQVGEIDFLGAQPWPGPHSLMLAYRAITVEPNPEPKPDGQEIDAARFFSRTEYLDALRSGRVTAPNRNAISTAALAAWLGQELPEPRISTH